MPRNGRFPRLLERDRIERTVQTNRELLAVDRLVALVQAVEQHPFLHGRQRVDVCDRPTLGHDPVQLRLRHVRERKISRRLQDGARVIRQRADAAHRLAQPGHQAFDGFRGMQVAAVGPQDLQPSVDDPCAHLEDVAACLSRAARGAGRYMRGPNGGRR